MTARAVPSPLPGARVNTRAETFVAGPSHIETFSGLYLDVADPDPFDIRLEDIAHGLANACRYAGQTRIFYSVAEHATLVAARLRSLGAPLRLQLAGLHHDDPEAYLGDITRPLKTLVPRYRQLEHRMWEAIREGLSLGDCPIDHPQVKEADHWALAAEAYYLLPSKGAGWACDGLYDPNGPSLWLPDIGDSPRRAEDLWLARHAFLGAMV
jgi:hypothetical protein